MTLTYSDPETAYNTEDFLWNGEETPNVLLRIGERSLNYVGGSLRLKHVVDRRSTARLALESDVQLSLREGERVLLRLNKKRAFTGILSNPVETWPGPENRIYQIEAVSFSALADRRIVTATYQNTTVEAIVADLVSDFLDAENVSIGDIAPGPAVTEAVFSYIPVSRALDSLAERSGFHWYIDGLRRLWMGPPAYFPAPFSLDDIDEFADQASKGESNRDYRNRQYIRGGKAETTPRVDNFIGDGVLKTFVTGFPIARQPTVKVNNAEETVAVRGIGDPDAQWFWSRGSAELTQNDSETPLTSGDDLEVTYIGLFDLVVVSTDIAEVNRRKALEGVGTGIIERVDTEPTAYTAQTAFELAAGKLTKFGVRGRYVVWSTERTGLEPNQTITVNVPEIELDGQSLLITEIEVQDRAGRLIHTVRAVEGPDDNDWASWFKRTTDSLDPLAFRENISELETVSILTSHSGTWDWIELVTPIVFACFTVDDGYVLPTSTEEYSDVIGYSSGSKAYYGDGVADLLEAC